jgi:hypothetical protein
VLWDSLLSEYYASKTSALSSDQGNYFEALSVATGDPTGSLRTALMLLSPYM